MNLTDEMLRSAAADVRNAMLDSLSSSTEPDHTFSSRFEQKMQKLIHHQKKRYRFLKQVAAIILALMVCGGVWLAVDADASAAFLQWIQKIYENSVVYQFFGSAQDNAKFADYRPGWLPDGYVETKVTTIDSQIMIEYCNASGETLCFHYMEMDEHTQTETYLEGMEVPVELTVNGMRGMFYQTIDSAQSNELIWFDVEHDIVFNLSGYLDKTTMISVAESIFLTNMTN